MAALATTPPSRSFRTELIARGTDIRWDTRVAELDVGESGAAAGGEASDEAGGEAGGEARLAGEGRPAGGRVGGVRLASGEVISADAVVLAAGHSV